MIPPSSTHPSSLSCFAFAFGFVPTSPTAASFLDPKCEVVGNDVDWNKLRPPLGGWRSPDNNDVDTLNVVDAFNNINDDTLNVDDVDPRVGEALLTEFLPYLH